MFVASRAVAISQGLRQLFSNDTSEPDRAVAHVWSSEAMDKTERGQRARKEKPKMSAVTLLTTKLWNHEQIPTTTDSKNKRNDSNSKR